MKCFGICKLVFFGGGGVRRFGGCFLAAPVAHDKEFVAKETDDESRDAADRLSCKVEEQANETAGFGHCAVACGRDCAAEQGLHKDDEHGKYGVHDARNHNVVGAVEGFLSVEHKRQHLSRDRADQKADKFRGGFVSEDREAADGNTFERFRKHAACVFELGEHER